MSEKHKPAPVAWARMKCGKVISVFHDKVVAEFLAGFAASELVPLYMHAQHTPEAQVEVVGWQFYQDGKWWNGDDRIRDLKRNTQEAGFRVRDVYAAQQREEQRPSSSGKVREEFEAWASSFFANAPTKYKRDALPRDDPNYGDYASKPLQAAWMAWQASRTTCRKQGG